MERAAYLGVRTRTSLNTTTLSPPPSPISARSLIMSWNAWAALAPSSPPSFSSSSLLPSSLPLPTVPGIWNLSSTRSSVGLTRVLPPPVGAAAVAGGTISSETSVLFVMLELAI